MKPGIPICNGSFKSYAFSILQSYNFPLLPGLIDINSLLIEGAYDDGELN